MDDHPDADPSPAIPPPDQACAELHAVIDRLTDEAVHALYRFLRLRTGARPLPRRRQG